MDALAPGHEMRPGVEAPGRANADQLQIALMEERAAVGRGPGPHAALARHRALLRRFRGEQEAQPLPGGGAGVEIGAHLAGMVEGEARHRRSGKPHVGQRPAPVLGAGERAGQVFLQHEALLDERPRRRPRRP